MTKHIVLLQALASTPADLNLLLRGVDDDAGRLRPGSDAWSIAEVLGHLLEVEVRYRERLRRVVTEDRPLLPAIRPDDSVPAPAPLADLQARFAQSRAQTVAYLKELKLGQWQRPAVHETWGATKLRYLVQRLLEHDIEHMGQVVDILAALGSDSTLATAGSASAMKK